MSASDLSVAEPPQLQITRQDKVRGWLTLGVTLFVVGLPLCGIYWLRELYLFQPNLENAGGSVQLAVVGPQWLREFAGHDRDWLFGTPVRLFAPKREKVDDRWARRLARMTRLQTLGLANTKITDRGMTSLAPLTELEDLDLSNTAVGDAGLEQLRGLTNLQILSLAETQTSDEGLARLAHLERLTVLDLSGTRVRGSGLQHLAGMRSLRSLGLASTALNDAGLAYLPELPALAELDLGSTKITAAGLRALKGRKSISSLSIRSTAVDDTAVEILSNVGTLNPNLCDSLGVRLTVDIQGTKITGLGINRLKAASVSVDFPGRTVSGEIRAQRDWAVVRAGNN